MPFLRVIRDKRGYETTYLMHWFQEGGRQRSRILYAFRTPTGAHVGRDPLDRGVMRQIEDLNPDIRFDWKSVLAERHVIEPSPEPRRRKGRRETTAAAPEAPAATPVAPPPPAPGGEAAAGPARPPIPSAIVGESPDERVSFLQTWYPAIKERIDARAAEPERRAALLALAERMNPAGWPEDEPREARLQQAAEALERLSHVFGRRRRRTRRRPAGESGPPPAPSATSEES